jgi:hypothetical protein
LLPIHWGTFDLATHRWDQPIETLVGLGAERGARLIVPRHGEPVEPALVDGALDPWWRPVAALHGDAPRRPASDALAEGALAEPVD